MAVTAVPSQYLSDTIAQMQRQIADLQRAVGKPASSLADASNNSVHLADGSGAPVVAAKNQGVSMVMSGGAVTVADEQGRGTAPINASSFNGPVTGDTTGVHHGDVGTPTELHNHYGDLHGNSYGFHYGPVGDGTTQNQINALNIFGLEIHGSRLFGELGAAGGPFFTTYGDVGNGTNFFNLFGTVHAPSEGRMKINAKPLKNAGAIVDQVPISTWNWDPRLNHGDSFDHAGPMAEDVEIVAPWLIRKLDGDGPRLLSDRDLIGVLWAALQEARARIVQLEKKVKP